MRLTLPQQDIYFEQLLFPGEPIYNIGAKIEVNGKLNIDILKKAYVKLINQHDAYRTILVNNEGNVEVKFIDEHHSELGFIDFSLSKKPADAANRYMQGEFLKPFNLLDNKLLHVFSVAKVNDSFHYLFSMYHHIITDGWGTSLMFQRWVQNYNELIEFGKIKTEYPYTYVDFIKDDEDYVNSESFIQDKNYWVKKFNTLPENLFEKINSSAQINISARKELIIKRNLYNQLNELAATYKCSTFHVILAILFAYFGRKHQNNNFAIGLPVLNRGKATYKKTVGLFMGVSPLRISLDFEESFEKLVTDIKAQLRSDYRYQRFPLGKLINELQLFGEKERLFNITLSYEKQDYSDCFVNTKTNVIPLTHQSERVALAVYIREFNEQEDVKIDFDYNLNYFDHENISQVTHHFENLIHHILINPTQKIKELVYMSQQEEYQLLKKFNDTKFDYSENKTMIDFFKSIVKIYPDKIAVVDDSNSFTFAQLNVISDQIASFIITTFGKKNKCPVAVLLERSVNMVATLLGIIKSGRAYIPLDPNFPVERLNYIISNSESKLLITEKHYELINATDVSVVKLEHMLEQINEFEKIVTVTIHPKDSVYIIYTSGSTGNPKGVEISHRSLINFLISIQNKPGILVTDILFSVTTYSFDISILEIFGPLISGATLFVADQKVLSDPQSIIEKIKLMQASIIQATPSFYQLLFNAGWKGSKKLKVLCGGDLLNEMLAEKLIENSLEVWNMYGPTETTIWSSIKKIEQPKDASVIGKPINNTQFYILDATLSLKPLGAVGSIYIAGHGLAKGYYKKEELTQTKFIKNPFDKVNELMYETGDLGKWNSKGEIEFLGRNDNQVKIRGYRIELGDIESQLNKYEEINDAVVIAKKGEEQDAVLVAYILTDKESINVERLINKLKISLPAYMVPSTIISLKEFPLTPNQKVDRKQLSNRPLQHITDRNFKPPVSYLQKQLAGYWQEIFNNKTPIGINDNFFALGGHSLNAVKLIGLISKRLLFKVSLKAIFENPTIESLANNLKNYSFHQPIVIPTAMTKHYYDLTPAQYNIWLESQQINKSVAYNMSAAYVLSGIVNCAKIENAINKIIDKYEILRTNFIEINGVPYQRINSSKKNLFSVHIDKSTASTIENDINGFINSEFDLKNDALIKTKIFQLDNDQNLFVFSTHHIIMDGLSLEVFILEFIMTYNEGVSEENEPKIQFKDYSEWLNKKIVENALRNNSFWRNYLHNYQYKYIFNRDYEQVNNKNRSSQFSFEVPTAVTTKLKKIALSENTTFYSSLVAYLNLLIYKLYDHTDICIGTVNSGRDNGALENQLGMFAKSVILRTQIQKEHSLVNLIKAIHQNLMQLNDYLDVPYDKIHSVFDVMLTYQNQGFSYESIHQLDDVGLTHYKINNNYSRIPLVFNMFEKNDMLKGRIDYNSDLFEEDTIKIIAQAYVELLNQAADNPLLEIDELNIKLESRKNKVTDFDFNF